MSEVEVRRLHPRDSFGSKEILRMRIAEEANLRGVWISTIRSDHRVLEVVGDQFYVKANNTERNGWVVNTAIVRLGDGNLPNNSVTRQFAKRLAEEARLAKEARAKKQPNSKSKKEQPNSKSKKVPIAPVAGACEEGDDVDIKILDTEDEDSDDVDSDDGENGKSKARSHPSPYIAQWLVPIIRGTIANVPMTSNHHLKQCFHMETTMPLPRQLSTLHVKLQRILFSGRPK
jgi:hypothetical protein